MQSFFIMKLLGRLYADEIPPGKTSSRLCYHTIY